jgi:hypothetical protein
MNGDRPGILQLPHLLRLMWQERRPAARTIREADPFRDDAALRDIAASDAAASDPRTAEQMAAPASPPDAATLRRRVASLRAAEQARAAQERANRDARQQQEIALLRHSSFGPLEQRRLLTRMSLAADRGETGLEVLRFPSAFCHDDGRAVNNGDPGWAITLSGLPQGLFDYWHDALRPLGYRLTARILDFPDGMPGDIGISLHWSKRGEDGG